MARATKVSVVIASWNGRPHLETCLAELRHQRISGFEWEVLVLDNGSDDGSADWVRAEHSWVRLIESSVNLGFCSGNNMLVAEAEGDLIALLNNDTRPSRDWLSSMVDALLSAPPDVAAVSGKILDWQGGRLDFARGVMVFDGHGFQLDYHRPLGTARIPDPAAELPFACGANMLIRRASFLAAGGLDEEYFAYLEDVDLGWRLWARGERVLFAPEGVVYHRSGATGTVLGNTERGYLIERNAFWTAYKNYESGLLERILPVILLTLMNRARTLLTRDSRQGRDLAASLAAEPTGILEKIRRVGARETLRRGFGKLRRATSGSPAIPTDDQTRAQLRALEHVLARLDNATTRRREVQAQRKRGDLEYFERFPPYLVPTYPGDEELFSSSAFRALWPAELPLIRASLSEVMELEPDRSER